MLKSVFFYNLLNAVTPKSHLIYCICYHNNADAKQMLYVIDRKMWKVKTVISVNQDSTICKKEILRAAQSVSALGFLMSVTA